MCHTINTALQHTGTNGEVEHPNTYMQTADGVYFIGLKEFGLDLADFSLNAAYRDYTYDVKKDKSLYVTEKPQLQDVDVIFSVAPQIVQDGAILRPRTLEFGLKFQAGLHLAPVFLYHHDTKKYEINEAIEIPDDLKKPDPRYNDDSLVDLTIPVKFLISDIALPGADAISVTKFTFLTPSEFNEFMDRVCGLCGYDQTYHLANKDDYKKFYNKLSRNTKPDFPKEKKATKAKTTKTKPKTTKG